MLGNVMCWKNFSICYLIHLSWVLSIATFCCWIFFQQTKLNWCFLLYFLSFSLSVALNLHDIVNISFHQKPLQIWVPGGKMWSHAQWTGKALSLPKLMSQKITWINSLMKCFVTSLGEWLVRCQFIVYYDIVFCFFPFLPVLMLVSHSSQKV